MALPPSGPEIWPVEVLEIDGPVADRLQSMLSAFYKNCLHLQFALSYHAHISIGDSDNMSHSEMLLFYRELVAQKEAEKASSEAAMNNKK